MSKLKHCRRACNNDLVKAICNHFCSGCIYHRDFTLFDVLAYHMVFNINVLGLTSHDRVLCQVNGTLIVTMEQDGFINSISKFHKEAPVTDTLVRGIHHGHVFCMGGNLSYSLLLLQGPAYCIIC